VSPAFKRRDDNAKEKYMSMTRLLYGLATLPLLAGVAFADPPKQSNDSKRQPMQLSNLQMDKVTAGWDFAETTISNESVTQVAVHQRAPNRNVVAVPSTEYPPAVVIGYNVSAQGDPPTLVAGPYNNSIYCNTCFINISNPALSIAASFR
jgi:hypothetical protein